MKLLVYWLLLFSPGLIVAQDYKASLMPDSLKENANAVMRFEELHVNIKSIDKVIVKHKWAITILNEAGDKFASYTNGYSKLASLSDISGHLIDENGIVIQKIKKKDIADVSGTDNDYLSLVSDDRVKHFSFYCKKYPYTVEFEDEEEDYGTYYLPYWQPISSIGFAVQQSRFIVEMPADYKIRYKQFNYDAKPLIVNGDSKITYTWQVANKPSFEYEIWLPPFDEITTKVTIAPTQFAVAGYTGDMSTWDGLAKFQLSLNKGRNELPDNIKKEVHKLVDGLATREEKVKVLYNYLQENTRYISIQLGIGGWQPLEAKFVAEKKFGDCKALSNYMVSLLKEAGIKAGYVVVKSGNGHHTRVKEDFPAPFYFDHVIACVPDTKDTIWLECTSQTESPGYMGSFTGDRKALMVTDTGGALVSTPRYPAEVNLQKTNVVATVADDGTLLAEVTTTYTGIQEEKCHFRLHDYTQKERDDYYNHKYDLPTYKVENVTYKETKGRIPIMNEHITVKASNYASITGKRLFIKPNLFNKEGKISTDKPRRFDIAYPNSFKDVDSINITIPQGYIPEAMPHDVSIQNKFGFYTISYQVNKNSIAIVRVCERKENRFAASDYLDLAKFQADMTKADYAKMVFVKE